eukprot:8713698-Pyramimonas_sp.AAC.1
MHFTDWANANGYVPLSSSKGRSSEESWAAGPMGFGLLRSRSWNSGVLWRMSTSFKCLVPQWAR